MKYYELTYLISPDLPEEERKNFSEEINSFLQEQEGILDKSSKLIKKKLGYPIKEKDSAFLKSITFYLKKENLSKVKKYLKEKKEVLRFLLLTKPVPRAIKKSPLKKKRVAPQKKVELKDIDEKLKQILKE